MNLGAFLDNQRCESLKLIVEIFRFWARRQFNTNDNNNKKEKQPMHSRFGINFIFALIPRTEKEPRQYYHYEKHTVGHVTGCVLPINCIVVLQLFVACTVHVNVIEIIFMQTQRNPNLLFRL